MRKLLIMYYHEVVKRGEGATYQKIEEEKFEAQMRYLQEQGYTSLFFSELGKALPEKAVIVSFDDGFRSVYDNAAPIMQKYGVKGNIYLPTAYIGQDEKFMDWDMVRRLQENGFEMQAHTHTHADIRTLSAEAMQREVETSNEYFIRELGKAPCAICLPFGTYDRRSVKLLKKTGKYRYILASYYGRAGERKLKKGGLLPRIGISDMDSIQTFEKKIKGKLSWKGPLQRARLFLHNLKGDKIRKYEY